MEIDFEKAYNEALERAKRLLDSKYQTMNAKRVVEEIFPELCESEDERIRKELIAILKASYNSGITLNNKKDLDGYLAYLEKQKENPKTADSIPSDCASDAKCEDRWHKVGDSLPDNGRLVLANDCLGNTLLARYDGEGNWEVSVYDNDDYYCRNTITKWCDIPSEKQKESLHIPETCKENADSFTDACKDVIVAIEKYLDWLTGYPDYAPKGKYSIRDMLYCLSLLEKQKEPENVSATTMIPSCWEVEQKEQKPTIAGNDFGWIDELKHDLEHPEELDQKVDDVLKQRKGIRALEWSKEDEHRRNDAIYFLESAMRHYADTSEIEKTIAWLKSLRPPLKDKEMKLKILKYLSTRCSSLEFEEVEDYLNNLRPSWKPSEEQMSALNYFIKLWGNSDDQLEYTKIFNTVKSLRDDLEKQM